MAALTRGEVQAVVRAEMTAMKDDLIREVREALTECRLPSKPKAAGFSMAAGRLTFRGEAENEVGVSEAPPPRRHTTVRKQGAFEKQTSEGSDAEKRSYRRLSNREDEQALAASAKELVLAESGGSVQETRLQKLSSMVDSHSFELMSAWAAILNAIWVGIQTDYAARYEGAPSPPFASTVDNGFCAFFVIEISLKICCRGRAFFTRMPDAKWNWFDLIVVGSQLAESSFNLVARSSGKHVASSDFLNIVRMLRMVRILRVARVASIFGELRKLVSSIAASLIPLCWTLLLIFLSIYMFAIMITHVVTEKLNSEASEVERREELEDFFGTLPKAMTTLYMIISEGIHWGEVMRPLVEDVSPWLRPAICLFVAFQLFAMMNVITAYFVDAAFKTANDNERKEVAESLLNTFAKAQNKGSGAEGDKHGVASENLIITREDFQSFLDHDEMFDFCDLLQIDPEDAEVIYDLIDSGGVGSLNSREFLNGLSRLVGPAKAEMTARISFEQRQYWHQSSLNQMAIMEALHKLDRTHNGSTVHPPRSIV